MKSTLFFFLLIPTFLMAQGPVDGFCKNKKALDIGFGISVESGSKYYAGRDLVPIARSAISPTLFAIYGISDRIDLQLNIPYIYLNNGKEFDFQDGSLYLKYRLSEKNNKLGKIALLGAIGYSHPLAEYQTNGGSALGQANNASDIRLIAQQYIGEDKFISVQGGYIKKSSPTPDAFSVGVKYGLLKPKVYADFWMEYYHSLGGTDYRGVGDLEPTIERGGFKGLGSEFIKVGGTVYKPINKNIGAYCGLGYIITGRNTFKTARLSIGIVYKPFK